MDDNTVLAEMSPSAARRGVAVGMLAALGLLLIYLAFSEQAGSMIGRVVLIGIGAGALALADMMRRATVYKIEMTSVVLRDTSGRELCMLDEIESVDRGAFAFKPSNGFLIRLSQPKTRVWAPGLWWRFGRRIGVGGVTPASQAKFMSELIALRLKGEKLY